MNTSIYLDGLSAAQQSLVKRKNERFRHSIVAQHDNIGPEAESYVDETFDRWIRGERITLERDQSPSKLDARDVLLAYLTNPDHASCDREVAIALIVPSMIERIDHADAITVSVSSFVNGRESGLVYTVEQPDGAMRSFSVYEHRNHDSMIINGCTGWDGESLPYVPAETSCEFFAEISCGNYQQLADALVFFIREAAAGDLADDAALAASCEHIDWNAIMAEQFSMFGDWLKARGAQPMDRIKDIG